MLRLSCGTRDLSLRRAGLIAPCGIRFLAACGTLVPRPGIELVSSALEVGFLTTGPPGKSQNVFFFKNFLKYSWFTVLCLIFAVEQSDSVIHTYILFHILFHYGLA